MAASWSNLDAREAKKFQDSFNRLLNFTFYNDEQSKSSLSLLLDEIVAVDVSLCNLPAYAEESKLLSNLAKQVPLHLELLVAKTCRVIFFFCTHKNIDLRTDDLDTLVQFLIDGLLRCENFVHANLLSALSAVANGNTQRLQKFHDTLFGARGLLLQLTDDTGHDEEVVVSAVKCISSFTNIKINNADCIEVHYLSACFDTLVHLLHRAPHIKIATQLQSKLLVYCFSGIQNIVLLKRLPNIELGTLFASVRAYMFYGLTSHAINIPTQLFPHAFMPFDPLGSSKQSKTSTTSSVVSGSDDKTNKSKARKEAGSAGLSSGDKGRGRRPRKKKGRGGGSTGADERPAEGRTSATNNLPPATSRTNALKVNTNDGYGPSWSNITPESEAESWESTWLKISSSDSEYSDTEGGKLQQQRVEAVRVRHCALNCFLNIVRVVDKKVMFGYWSSFIPDMDASESLPQMQSLFTTILKDPSPKCRMAAVASLTCMLESTRPYLAVAEDITTNQPAFTSLSAVLGSMVKQMHRCLLQSLVAEDYKAVITQIIKCLGSLVNNAPYHRLNPGLLTRVLKHVRHFFSHQDPNVRTACLTCVGSILGIKPPLMEISELIKPPRPPVGVGWKPNPGDSPLLRPEDAAYLMYPVYMAPKVASVKEEKEEVASRDAEPGASARKRFNSECVNSDEIKSSDNKNSNCVSEESPPHKNKDGTGNGNLSSHPSDKQMPESSPRDLSALKSETNSVEQTAKAVADLAVSGAGKDGKESNDTTTTLNLVRDLLSQEGDTLSADSGTASPHFGSDTPVFTDQLLQAHARETSWVIKFCLKSVQGQTESTKEGGGNVMKPEPLPIRLEALQVMSNLIKNYFPIIRHSVRILQELVQICIDDSNHIVILHGTKVLDELTQALERDVIDAKIAPNHVIPIQQVKDFWMHLLTSPLPTLLAFNPVLSHEGNNLVRSGACECMANIGDDIFTLLPTRKQIHCVTMVLGLARDDDKLIQASAVRALGIYVGYAALKEDVAFIIDAGFAILECMKSPCNSVRLKASWAMANLCDKLVINRDNDVPDFATDFPDSLLLQLVQSSGVAVKDIDKISCNAARAIGNLIRYLPAHTFQSPEMLTAVEAAVKGLVKNMNSGAMKVRWNSCYAASNAFQNSNLPHDLPWIADVLSMLAKAVQNCANFKVRINAALALATPSSRPGFGSSETLSNVWGSLVMALETAENINDFAEYRYKDSLISHICGAVLHLTSLVQLSDLNALYQSVHIKGHSFRTYMDKYIQLAESTKGIKGVPSVADVKEKLLKLEADATSDDQRRCLVALTQACVPEPDLSEEKVEKSSFQQVYD